MKWSTVASLAVLAESVGLLLTMGYYIIQGPARYEGLAANAALFTVFVVGVLMLLLTYFLYKSKNWARIAAIYLSLLSILAITAYVITNLVRHYYTFVDSILDIGLLLMLITPGLVFVLVLSHRDVRAEYAPASARKETERNA